MFTSAGWVEFLLANALGLSEPTTGVMLHLNEASAYPPCTVARWNATWRLGVSPVRVRVARAQGTLLYAHLLNVEAGTRLNAQHALYTINVPTLSFCVLTSHSLPPLASMYLTLYLTLPYLTLPYLTLPSTSGTVSLRWPRCKYVVLQASNMLWVRPGMELRVRAERCSAAEERELNRSSFRPALKIAPSRNPLP